MKDAKQNPGEGCRSGGDHGLGTICDYLRLKRGVRIWISMRIEIQAC
jgi:hypothetical protein